MSKKTPAFWAGVFLLIGKEVLFPPCAVRKRHAEELHENVIEEQDDGERADEVQQYAFHRAFVSRRVRHLKSEHADGARGDEARLFEQQDPERPDRHGEDHRSVDLEYRLGKHSGADEAFGQDGDAEGRKERQHPFREEQAEHGEIFAKRMA